MAWGWRLVLEGQGKARQEALISDGSTCVEERKSGGGAVDGG